MGSVSPDQDGFGVFLRERILEAGITIQKAADGAGISRQHLDRVLAGKSGLGDDKAVKLGPILRVDPGELQRRAVCDRLARKGDGTSIVPQGMSLYESTYMQMAGETPYCAALTTFSITALADGSVTAARTYESIRPVPGGEVCFIDFDDLLVEGCDNAPPSQMSVLERPLLKHESHSQQVGSRRAERFDFSPAPWTRENDPGQLTLRFFGTIPGAFKLERPSEVSASRWHSGDARWRVVHPTERLEVSMFFGPGLPLPEKWLEPWAWLGRVPLERAPSNAMKRAAASFTYEAKENTARLVVERPIPGYVIAIPWRMGQDPIRKEGR